jgi:hypothetical protein
MHTHLTNTGDYMKKIITGIFLSALLPSVAQAANDNPLDNLGNMSLENLANVVTSVSKKPEDSFRSLCDFQ